LHLISLGGVGRDVFLARITWNKPAISWSRAVLPPRVRMRRQELERSKPSLDAPTASVQSESEELELLQLQQGEAVFLKVQKILMRARTIITPRDHSVKRGGNNFVSNYGRSQGTRDSDHSGSGLQCNYA